MLKSGISPKATLIFKYDIVHTHVGTYTWTNATPFQVFSHSNFNPWLEHLVLISSYFINVWSMECTLLGSKPWGKKEQTDRQTKLSLITASIYIIWQEFVSILQGTIIHGINQNEIALWNSLLLNQVSFLHYLPGWPLLSKDSLSIQEV